MTNNIKKIVVSEYPKSGGNWVVNLLGDALGIPKRDLYDVQSKGGSHVPLNHPWYIGVEELDFPIECVVKSHELPNTSLINFPATYVHLVRDGRDVVVSKYYYEKDFCVKNEIYKSFNEPFDDYVCRVSKEWHDFVNSWLKQYVVMVRYEDFLKDAEAALSDLLTALGYSVANERISAAVAVNTKEHMKAALGKAYKYNSFVRKGESGDWKNNFEWRHSQTFVANAGETLIRLGYEQNNLWADMEYVNSISERCGIETKNNELVCWCGCRELGDFSPTYSVCGSCGSLVSKSPPTFDVKSINDDADDLYGKDYYLRRLPEEFGYPDIQTRARNDLPERCLYWLKALLQYKLPHGEVLELGCAHGGFVALLEKTGFSATGLELSPWLVEFARKTFGVRVLQGPVEIQDIEKGTLDVIALMDVIEHLQDPLATMRHCSELLKPDGIFLIQTPSYHGSVTYEDMLATEAPFIQQLKSEEHVYLFTPDSVRVLLSELGFTEIQFTKAIFDHYDMFLVASRNPLVRLSNNDIELALTSTGDSRIVLALCDLSNKLENLENELKCLSAERSALKNKETVDMQETLRQARQEILALRGSLSWRLMAPFRWIADQLKG